MKSSTNCSATDATTTQSSTSVTPPTHTDNLLANITLSHQLLPVYNHNYEKLHVSLFQTTTHTDICILFMHGYGSNRLECCNVLKVLKEPYSLCSFDFSGSGKSEGDRVTYGAK